MTMTLRQLPPPPHPLEWTLATALVVLLCAAEARAADCPDDKWCVDKSVAVEVRDKARGYEVLCSELDPAELPSGLAEVCEDPGATSRVWVEAQRYEEAKSTADELQQKLNVREGRVVELEGRIGRLEEDLGERSQEVGRLRGKVRVWRVVGVSAGGLAALSTVVWVGDLNSWWDI